MQFVSIVVLKDISCLPSAYARVRWAHADQWGSSNHLGMLRILTQQHHCSHSNKACLCSNTTCAICSTRMNKSLFCVCVDVRKKS